METLLKLAGLMSLSGNTEVTKLRSAVYLAQSVTGRVFYSYRLAQGSVSSDQLDQDLSQLEAGGFVERAEHSGELSFRPKHKAEAAVKWILPEDVEFRTTFEALLREDISVLEAAATCKFFHVRGLGDPEERVEWYRRLDPEQRNRAVLICQDFERSGNQKGE